MYTHFPLLCSWTSTSKSCETTFYSRFYQISFNYNSLQCKLAFDNSRQVFSALRSICRCPYRFDCVKTIAIWLYTIFGLLVNFHFLVTLDSQFYPMFNYFLLLLDDFKLLRIIWDSSLGTNTSNSWWDSGVQRTDATPSPSTVKAFTFSHFLFRWFIWAYL